MTTVTVRPNFTPMELIAAAVRRLRLAAGWTQQELAENAGVARATVQNLEAERRTAVRVSTARKLAGALGVPIVAIAELPDVALPSGGESDVS